MKRILCSLSLLLAFFLSFSHDFFLLPEEFFLSKGQTLNTHLLVGNEFAGVTDKKYDSSKTSGFWLMEGGKKTDLKPATTDSVIPVFSRKIDNSGLVMVAMERNATEMEMDRAKFLEYLHEEGLDKIAESIEKGDQQKFKETYTRYMKALAVADKPSGNIYSEKLGQELEILLLQNPYKLQYGDDITAQILFKGKPLNRANASVITKGLNGNIFPVVYRTDDEGKIYFKLNRAGTWMVRLVHMQPSADKSSDFKSWWASYTFGFK